MPKIDIDYSNTDIYKITCKDPKVQDVYVGHTTNFVQRKHYHKQNCNNTNNHICKLYEVIRKNGGWKNWTMEIINFFNCQDHYEARKKEQEYFILLNATLNSIEPMPKPKSKDIFVKNEKIIKKGLHCDICNINCVGAKSFETHTKTNKHIKNQLCKTQPNKKMPENAVIYFCNSCDFKCSKKSNYSKHLLTAKHKNLTNPNFFDAENIENAEKKFVCDSCKKTYNHASTLSTHKKKCNVSTALYIKNPVSAQEPDPEPKSLTLMVVELIKSNQELQKQMLDVCTKIQPITTNNVNTHSHNKTFNMQIFLNEQCKDAMNIMDFVDTFKLDYSDLEKVGEVGYVEGISNIIIQKLNEMDIYKRPIHCSDAKRETTFVKDKNVWEKENGNRDRLRLAIKHITKKNTDMLLSWCEAHPGSCDSDNYLNDVYIEIVRQAMGGGDIEENENKIMRKIARSVLIDKDL